MAMCDCETRRRKLPTDMDSKALLRGTYKRMVHRIWPHECLKIEIVNHAAKSVAIECAELCSTKGKSVARQTSSQGMLT